MPIEEVTVMEVLRERARELLVTGVVRVIIGYEAGSHQRPRAAFVRRPEDASRLILNERCVQNLAVYLHKPEVRSLGKPALVATPPVLRTLLQLAAENRFADGDVLALAVNQGGEIVHLPDLKAIEVYTAGLPKGLGPTERERLDSLGAMSREERWEFWQEELGHCLKCYACRAACPLCYCERCLVECNQPQWIPVAPHALGNLEWHISRALHLAGRCLDCGACADACPVDIPLSLLTQKLGGEVSRQFGHSPGITARPDYPLSTFRLEDKEDFIR